MFRRFYPTVYVSSAYAVDFSKLYQKGYRALVLDIDNTLVKHGAPPNKEAVAFFEELRAIGFSTCIISNNHEPRVKSFADVVKSDYIFDAGKPSRRPYLEAMRRCGGTKLTTLFMGDQLFTDIYGANRAGLKSILVKPIFLDPEFQIRLKRLGERIVMPFYFRYRKKHPASL